MQFVESRSIDYVPLAERHGKVWHLWPIWFTGDAHLATLATGALSIPLGLSFAWAALAILAGGALGTFFMSFHSSQGPELGLPQMIQSRPQFGYRGALLVWFVALVTYIGYNAFNQVLIGATMNHLVGAKPIPTIIIFTGLALFVAICGYDWIHRAQRVLAAVMIAALTVFTIGAIGLVDARLFTDLSNFKAIPFLTQFFAAAAYQLSWSIYVSDYSRYLPRDVGVRASFWWTFMGAFIGGAWMMMVGALAAALFPSLDIIAAVRFAGDRVAPHFGTVLLIASSLTMLTATSLNLYGASLTLLSIVDSFRKIVNMPRARLIALAIVGVTSTSLAASSSDDLRTQFEHLLAILIYLFTPWTAINLVDFFIVRRGHYSIREIFNPDGIYGRWNWRGLWAYAIGFVAMVPFFSTGFYRGPIADLLGGADISMLIGLPVSAIAYLWMCRSLDLVAERRIVDVADIGLEAEAAAGARDGTADTKLAWSATS
jgi:NCS1 family nucleobase:cation symporter-1